MLVHKLGIFSKFAFFLSVAMLASCGGGSNSTDNEDTPNNIDMPNDVDITNEAPLARAGNDALIEETTTIILDASSSTDPENEILNYSWVQTSGVVVDLIDNNTVQASFVAPDVASEEFLTFELTVTDTGGNTDTDDIQLQVAGITECINTANDSQNDSGIFTRVRSESNGTGSYAFISSVRQNNTGNDITIDYMVHESVGVSKGLIFLIAGGQMNSSIQGSGSTLTNAGNNFLVRSAHLFAAQGYTVVTMDRPSDYLTDVAGNTFGSAYDGYRNSMRHAVDISTIVNAVNTNNLPMFIAGTSRGAISAVVLDKMSSGISLSAPVTTGGGLPVNAANFTFANLVNDVHVTWHTNDACSVSTPAGASGLVDNLKAAGISVVGREIAGGFDNTNETNPCQARRLHGFFGIESCAVKKTTSWFDILVSDKVPATRPIANSLSTATAVNFTIDLSTLVSGVGPFTYSIPQSMSSLNAVLSLSDNILSYNMPAGVTGSPTDSLVYVVHDANGGVSHNVIKIALP